MGIKKNDPGTIPRSSIGSLGLFYKLSILWGTVQTYNAFFI
ncbi:hypothetical protein SAMN05216243_2319 [Sediminibacillus albus]|uniref:Uncharacterized protein n=1 Tax=Sediminibacillus albus TaxID=407036 RepID=A0A1G8ZZL1_9BACI|nr:hypothetical protein SAMN05216243_2319 [Sediminibacillus albus]